MKLINKLKPDCFDYCMFENSPPFCFIYAWILKLNFLVKNQRLKMEFIRLWPGENANSRWRSMDKIIFKAYFSWLCFIVYSEKNQDHVLKIASCTSTNATYQSKLSHWENSARFELYLKMTFSAGSCFAVFCSKKQVRVLKISSLTYI